MIIYPDWSSRIKIPSHFHFFIRVISHLGLERSLGGEALKRVLKPEGINDKVIDTGDRWGRTGVWTCEHKEQGKEWPEAKLNERKEETFYFSSQRVYISF